MVIHSSVALQAFTQPVDTAMSMEEFIAYCARVSNPKNQKNHLTAKKLLRFLARERHWSPFEMANLVIEIKTTRDIARQILRHRSFTFQEFSQRYAEVGSDTHEIREARLQDTQNRQSSIEIDDPDLQHKWNLQQELVNKQAHQAYRWALEQGIAKEVARAVLPEGLTMSRMYVNGTVRSWLHYCSGRTGLDTQKEHRLLARQCWKIVCDRVPSLAEIEL
jgi:thymidylate synthase (FAD)